jgi:hypothetical protein
MLKPASDDKEIKVYAGDVAYEAKPYYFFLFIGADDLTDVVERQTEEAVFAQVRTTLYTIIYDGIYRLFSFFLTKNKKKQKIIKRCFGHQKLKHGIKRGKPGAAERNDLFRRGRCIRISRILTTSAE